MLAGPDDERALGRDQALAGADGVLVQLGRRQVRRTRRPSDGRGGRRPGRGVGSAERLGRGHRVVDSWRHGRSRQIDRPRVMRARRRTAGVGFHSRVGRDATTLRFGCGWVIDDPAPYHGAPPSRAARVRGTTRMTDTLIPDREQATTELADLRPPDRPVHRRRLPAGPRRAPVRDREPGDRPADHRGRRGRLGRRRRGGRRRPQRRPTTARWSRIDPGARKRILLAGPTSIEANARELGLIETIDAGKPITDTVGLDMPETAACIRWHAEAIDKLYGQVAPSPEGTVATITREPVGVVGAVVPWNYPAQMAAWKLGPALATGNTVVIKPASTTSLSLLRIAELGRRGRHPGRRAQRRDRARATRSARRSAATRTSTASRSPARPRSAGGSSPGRPSRTSSASCSSSAARARRSCSAT